MNSQWQPYFPLSLDGRGEGEGESPPARGGEIFGGASLMKGCL